MPNGADAGQGQDTGQTSGIQWDLILQALAGVAALAAWVAVVGGARVWARLHAANIPETQTLAALPKDLFIVVGLQTLLVPLLLGAMVALLVYLSRPVGSSVSGVPSPVGSPAAPPPGDPYVLRDWFKTLRPVLVVSDYIGRRGRRAALIVAAAVTIGVAAIMLVLADAEFKRLAVLLLAAAVVAAGFSIGLSLGPRGALALFGVGAVAAITITLLLVMRWQYIVALLLISLVAAWLTLGLVAEKTAGKAALSLFAALAIWSGALLFTATAGAKDPKLQPARVHLKDRVERGLLLGRTGDRLLLAQDTETQVERDKREEKAGATGEREDRSRRFERQVLVLADDDIEHVVVGPDMGIIVTVSDAADAKGQQNTDDEKLERDPQPGPTATATPSPEPSVTATPTPEQGEEQSESGEPSIPPERNRKVIARADGHIDGVSMQFQVMRLLRRGEMLILDARVVSRDDPARETEGVLIGDAFDDGRRNRHGAGDYSVDGIKVIDPFTSESYGIARDTRSGCTCTARLNRETIEPGKPFPLVAFFRAPDADSETLEITVPRFEPLLDVKVG